MKRRGRGSETHIEAPYLNLQRSPDRIVNLKCTRGEPGVEDESPIAKLKAHVDPPRGVRENLSLDRNGVRRHSIPSESLYAWRILSTGEASQS